MDYSSYQYLDIEIRDGIAFVTLNGPARGNAFDGVGHGEMSHVLRDIARDPDVRAVVLTGSGRAFSVGATMERFAEVTKGDPWMSYRALTEAREMVYSAIDCDAPVVCALNGPVNGGALTFALMADVIIAERQVVIRDPHVAGSLTAGDGGALTWPLAMGLLRAKRYLLTGDPLTADEACELGLVTEVVDTGASLARATEYAVRFAAAPQMALRSTKRSLNQYLRSAAVTAFDVSVAFEQLTQILPETQATLLAMTEQQRAKSEPGGAS
jgi:enoyl-CoA hydratase